MLFTFNTPTFAKNSINEEIINSIKNIDKIHSDYFGSFLIQDYQGRIKPVNSLAIEIVNKIARKDKIFNLDENQFFLSMMLYPKVWQNIEFIKIKNDKLKEILKIDKNKKAISFNDIYTKDGKYKLQNLLENANAKKPISRTKLDKELIKVDERLNIAYSLFIGIFSSLSNSI